MGGGMGGTPTAEGKSPAVGAGTMSPNAGAPAGTGALNGLPSWTSGMQLPEWASSVTKEQFDKAVAGMQQPAAAAAAPVTNLGFPTATPTQYSTPAPGAAGFTHDPYPTSTDLPHIGAPDRVIPPAATPTTPAAPTTSPDDWLYPGNLPTDFHPRTGKEFGMPWDYAATGTSITSGYGGAGDFGGVAGHGSLDPNSNPVLPQMAAGTQLTGAQIDQYNRVRRADYDRYMSLYGVGYDLPAYRNALNNLVYQFNTSQVSSPGG